MHTVRVQSYSILELMETRFHVILRTSLDVLIYRAIRVDREETVRTFKSTLNRVPLVATCHSDRHNLSQILHCHLPILHISPRMKSAVPEPPLITN